MRNASGREASRLFAMTLFLGSVFTVGCGPKEDVAAGGGTASRRAELARGYQAFEQRRYDDAIAAAERVLSEDSTGPGSAEALYLQGRVHEQKARDPGSSDDAARRHLREAQGLYMRALSTSPPQPLEAHARAGLANASYFLEDYATAAREWAAAYPHITDVDAKAWVGYRAGLSEQRRGNFSAADKHFANVQHIFPGSEQARRAAAHLGAKAFHVQVGIFATSANAQNAVARLKAQGFSPVRSTDLQGRHVIGVGPIPTYQQAKAMRDRLIGQYPGASIVP